jgi:hypothetical protein
MSVVEKILFAGSGTELHHFQSGWRERQGLLAKRLAFLREADP